MNIFRVKADCTMENERLVKNWWVINSLQLYSKVKNLIFSLPEALCYSYHYQCWMQIQLRDLSYKKENFSNPQNGI